MKLCNLTYWHENSFEGNLDFTSDCFLSNLVFLEGKVNIWARAPNLGPISTAEPSIMIFYSRVTVNKSTNFCGFQHSYLWLWSVTGRGAMCLQSLGYLLKTQKRLPSLCDMGSFSFTSYANVFSSLLRIPAWPSGLCLLCSCRQGGEHFRRAGEEGSCGSPVPPVS